jgi:hypothetical protein
MVTVPVATGVAQIRPSSNGKQGHLTRKEYVTARQPAQDALRHETHLS